MLELIPEDGDLARDTSSGGRIDGSISGYFVSAPSVRCPPEMSAPHTFQSWGGARSQRLGEFSGGFDQRGVEELGPLSHVKPALV